MMCQILFSRKERKKKKKKKNNSKYHLLEIFFFIFFSRKQDLTLNACVKSYFLEKKKKNVSKCRLLNFLSRMQSVNMEKNGLVQILE